MTVIGALTCLATLDAWQAWHCLHHSRTSLRNPGQMNRSATSRVVGLAPAWLREWKAAKTHSSAPESTRKDRLEMLSLMEMVPREWQAAAINGRPFRFPMEAARPGASWGRWRTYRSTLACRISYVRNRVPLVGAGTSLVVCGGGH